MAARASGARGRSRDFPSAPGGLTQSTGSGPWHVGCSSAPGHSHARSLLPQVRMDRERRAALRGGVARREDGEHARRRRHPATPADRAVAGLGPAAAPDAARHAGRRRRLPAHRPAAAEHAGGGDHGRAGRAPELRRPARLAGAERSPDAARRERRRRARAVLPRDARRPRHARDARPRRGRPGRRGAPPRPRAGARRPRRDGERVQGGRHRLQRRDEGIPRRGIGRRRGRADRVAEHRDLGGARTAPARRAREGDGGRPAGRGQPLRGGPERHRLHLLEPEHDRDAGPHRPVLQERRGERVQALLDPAGLALLVHRHRERRRRPAGERVRDQLPREGARALPAPPAVRARDDRAGARGEGHPEGIQHQRPVNRGPRSAMRKLLASLVLVPALALAQTPIQPPPGRPSNVRPPPTGQVVPRPGVSPTPAPGAPTPQRPGVAPTPPGVAPTPPGEAGPTVPARPGGARQTEPLRTTDSKCVPIQGRFMLTFNKADIVDILEQASRWTCRNFVYTEDVARGKITLLSKTPVTADEAYAAFLAALNSNNISVYATGRYYKLIRTADSKKNPIPTFTGSGAE